MNTTQTKRTTLSRVLLAITLALAAFFPLSCDQGTTPKADEPAKNADSALTALTLSTGTLNPAFAAATTSYDASVPNATTGITVTATASAANATIAVRANGGAYAAVASGTTSPALALNEGTNVVDVKVTAENGTVTAYAVTVTRALPPDTGLSSLILSTGTLDPAFVSGTTAYTASVPNATAGITVTPTASAAGSTIEVRVNSGTYATVASGSASAVLALNAGENEITIRVTAPSTATATYAVTVTRVQPTPTLTLSFVYGVDYGVSGKTSADNIYVAWIEKMDGTVIQNLTVCNRLLNGTLTNTALPFWKFNRYDAAQVTADAVTGATKKKQDFSATKALKDPSVTKFKVCFETDRSFDPNDWFDDQPALLYSAIVDLANPQPSYALTLEAWTPNEGTAPQIAKYFATAPKAGEKQTILDFITNKKDPSSTETTAVFGAADPAQTSTCFVGSLTLKVE